MQQVEYSDDNTGIDTLLAGEQKYNDTYNANALIDAHSNAIRYIKGWGWLAWDGKRWERDAEDRVIELAKATLEQMAVRAARLSDSKERGPLLAHVNRSLDYPKLRNMVNSAKSDPRITANVKDFDADPMLLNVQNGTIDLRTGELRDHNPDDLITQVAACDYEPDTYSEEWDGFVLWVADRREDLRDYIQTALGYSLTGDTSEKCLFFLHGPGGNNGKSTLQEAVLHVLGDYGTSTETDTILSKRGASGGIPNDLAALAGKRYVITSEPEEGQQFRMGRIKKVTGSDTITARFLNKEFFTYRPVYKIWLAANNKPTMTESNDAAWSRVKMVPFDARVDADTKDPDLPRKLREAAPAILAWMVRGCIGWQWQGKMLVAPSCMLEANQDYRSEEDPFAAFLEECCIAQEGATVSVKALLEAYRQWLHDNPDAPDLSQKTIRPQVEGHGFKTKRTSGWHVLGLHLGSAEPEANTDEDDEEGIFGSNPTIDPNWRASSSFTPHQVVYTADADEGIF